jgi:hypothetical protein
MAILSQEPHHETLSPRPRSSTGTKTSTLLPSELILVEPFFPPFVVLLVELLSNELVSPLLCVQSADCSHPWQVHVGHDDRVQGRRRILDSSFSAWRSPRLVTIFSSTAFSSVFPRLCTINPGSSGLAGDGRPEMRLVPTISTHSGRRYTEEYLPA